MTAEHMTERLIRYRKAQGLTQKELADKCDLTQSTISTMENGEYYPSMYTFLKICEGLNITPTEFFESEDDGVEVFTNEEYMMLKLWNTLDLKNRHLIVEIMKCMQKEQE